MVKFDYALCAMRSSPESQRLSSALTLVTELLIDFWCDCHHLQLRLMVISVLRNLMRLAVLSIRTSNKSAYRRVIHFFPPSAMSLLAPNATFSSETRWVFVPLIRIAAI